MKKNTILTFCFGLIPGAGQMYQKYMKRGLSIMCLAGVLLSFAVMLETIIFIIPFIIALIYSFFDTYYLRDLIGTKEQIKDDYIFQNISFNSLKENKLLGIGIILIGLYLFLNNVAYGILKQTNFEVAYQFIKIIREYFPSLIVSSLTIGVGVKMMSNK